MKKKIALFLLCAYCVLLFGRVPVSAATHEFDVAYVSIDLPDDILILTSDTSKYDDVWTIAGVTDPANTIKEYEAMGVIAAFYSPTYKTTVNFIQKKTTESVNGFNFLGKTNDEIVEYLTGIMTPSEGLTIGISVLEHEQTPFFRMTLDLDTEEHQAREVIYGTLINGQMIQFDCFNQNAEPVDETLLKQVANGVHFTKIFTIEEYNELAKKAWIKLGIIAGIIVLAIGAAIFAAIRHNKKINARSKIIASEMQDFRERKKAGQVNTSEAPRYTVDTRVTDAVINDFCFYSTWLRNIVRLAVTALLFALLILLMLDSQSIVYMIVTAGIAVVILYNMYSRSEKVKATLKKELNTASKPLSTCRFFGEYFTVSGLGSISEYVYKQVLDIKSYHNMLYIYISLERAVIIDKSSLTPETVEEIKKLINSNRITK